MIAPFIIHSNDRPNPCRELWLRVLLYGVHDADAGRDPGWIGSRDFHMVCALAGLDGDAVASALDRPRQRLTSLARVA